jgi:hypothetical protein
MIHIQRGNSRPALGRLSTDNGAFLDPLKMVIPPFRSRVKEWDRHSTFGINRFEPSCFVAIAHWTRQAQILLVVRATLRLGDNVINFKQRANDVL